MKRRMRVKENETFLTRLDQITCTINRDPIWNLAAGRSFLRWLKWEKIWQTSGDCVVEITLEIVECSSDYPYERCSWDLIATSEEVL